MISVVIPVKDGGSDLVRCLEAIARQQVDEDVEVVVVDSGSTDGSAARARQLGAARPRDPAGRVQPRSDAESRRSARPRRGSRLHDAGRVSPPTSAGCELLVAPLRDDDVAGVYGRQLPHDGATPPERYFLDFLYGDEARRQRLATPGDITFEETLFSNVNSAMSRETWRVHPFAEDLIMSEDQEWARRALLAGKTLVYEPRAAVRHSHAYSVADAFRRFFDSGVSADRAYVERFAGVT